MAGEAVLKITIDSNNVQKSNFANNSFQIKNTGDKTIAKVEIDATNALYSDAVFDPFAKAGDTTSKPLTINTNGGTGVVTPSNASYIGAGGTKGYNAIQLFFDKNKNNGFEPGETIGFSIDMDSNSIAGTDKKQLNAGTNPLWDTGGVSGAELIGSTFKVTFTDGTTATGQLQGADNQAGAQALASQDSPDLSVTLKVNGLDAGDVGTYDANPSVIVNGPAGETARVVLTKGFIQPVTPYAQFLQDQLDDLAASDFPANNAVEFQTVDVKLTGKAQNISNLFNFSGVDKFNFPEEDQLPLGFVASIIDPDNEDLPIGSVTQPIYLEFEEQISEPEPNPNGTITFEAEDLNNISGYSIEKKAIASEGKMLSLLGNGQKEVGTASFNFTGTSGKYNVILGTFDENDGEATLNITHKNNSLAQIVLDQNFASNAPNATTKVEHIVAKGLEIAKGDSFTIIGAEDKAEPARFDFLRFVPVGTVPEPEPEPKPEPNPNSSAIRINAGGEAYTDLNGNVWNKDAYFIGGNLHSTSDAINRTELDPIYQTERWLKNLSYNIPVNNGLYSVNLHFAEIHFDSPNLRKFDIGLEGEKVVNDLDIYASTKNAFDPGHDTALVLNFPQVEIKDKNFDLDLSAGVNNAKISAIELIPLQGAEVILQESQGTTVVTEKGNGDNYSLVLTEKPSNNVIIDIETDKLLKTNKSQVIFTPENWSTSQTVAVNAVNNNQASGTKFGSISHKITSNDSDYNG